jgi:2-oxoglutarate ferredoxin oxidoreductase subunit beta
MSEIIATLGGVAYCARTAVNTIKNIAQTKRAIRRAFETQIKGEGFGFVEVLATCPTNWRMSSVAANERVGKEMIPEFPLGVFKDAAKEE